MPKESQKNVSKEDKKLRSTVNRIIKRRKKEATLEEELASIKKINDLLESEDISVEALPDRKPVDEPIHIPAVAPGWNLWDADLKCGIFSETTLKLSQFTEPGEIMFGRPVNTLSPALFRKCLLTRVFDLRCDGVSEAVRHYVLHLLTSSASPPLVLACADFLKRFPCSVTPEIIAPLLVNLGMDAKALWGSEFAFKIPDNFVSDGSVSKDFCDINIEKLAEYLSFSLERNLISCDASAKPIIVAFSKMVLDYHVRGSPILSTIIRLLSVFAARCAVTLGSDIVADWLLRNEDHPLNQLELCRLLRTNTALQRALLQKTLSNVLEVNISLHTPLELRDVRVVVRTCRKQSTKLLPVYVAFQLLITMVPALTVAPTEVHAISKELTALESQFSTARESSDGVRLRAAIAQLRGLLVMTLGSQQYTFHES